MEQNKPTEKIQKIKEKKTEVEETPKKEEIALEETTETKLEEEKEKQEVKAEEKKPGKKKQEKIIKEEAKVYGRNLSISKKHSVAICDFIRGKRPEAVLNKLEDVLKFKTFIPMKGEIPHRKGGVPGRYPKHATKAFIKLVKSLISNASVNGVENCYISLAKADRASRPYRRFGSARFKRTNVLLVVKSKMETKKSEGKK